MLRLDDQVETEQNLHDNFLRLNSKKGSKENFGTDVCRLCENILKTESFRGTLTKSKTTLFKKNIYSLFNNFYEENFDYLKDTDPDNQIILPCKCLIPIHTKCLLKLLLLSQNLRCENCGHIIIFKIKRKKPILIKLFQSDFLISTLIFLILFGVMAYLLYLCFSHRFNVKYEHIFYIAVIVILSLTCVLIAMFANHIISVYNAPKKEKLSFVDFTFNNGKGVNDLTVRRLNSNVSDRGTNYKKGKKSAKIFSSFLKFNHSITQLDIAEYLAEKNLKSICENKTNQKIISIILHLKETFDKQKWTSKQYRPVRLQSSGMGSQFQKSILEIIEKNPKIQANILNNKHETEDANENEIDDVYPIAEIPYKNEQTDDNNVIVQKYKLKMTKIDEAVSIMEDTSPRKAIPVSLLQENEKKSSNFYSLGLGSGSQTNMNKPYANFRSSQESIKILRSEDMEKNDRGNLIVVPKTSNISNMTQNIIRLQADVNDMSPINSKSISPNISEVKKYLGDTLILNNNKLQTEIEEKEMKAPQTENQNVINLQVCSPKLESSAKEVISNTNNYQIANLVINTDRSNTNLVINCGDKGGIDKIIVNANRQEN